MSTEEDPELRDLVAKCLENNGVLGKLRAQLRASTFLALDQQDDPKVAFPISNSSVQQFVSSKEGTITMSLMRELLTFFNMQFSLAVFDPESCEGVSYQPVSRTSLITELGLGSVDPEKPLLHEMVLKLMKEGTSIPVSETKTEQLPFGITENQKEKLVNQKVNGDDYEDEDFQSSSSASASKNEMKEPSVEEELDELASDLLASQSSNAENDTIDKSTSNSTLSVADHVETL